jgi:Mesyanzhinovviridae DNA helicase
MKIVVDSGKMTIHGPLPLEFLKVLSTLNGRKIWSQSKYVKVDASPWNIKKVKNSGFPIEWEDKSHDLEHIDELQQIFKNYGKTGEPVKHNYQPKYDLKEHQVNALNISCYRHVFAYYIEMGLGKTALTIANFSILYMEGKIDGVLIFAPKGPHKQWLGEEIPKHIDPSIKLNMSLWTSGKYYLQEELKVNGVLNIFAINIDAINTTSGAFAVNQFINLFRGKIFMIIDEAHQIMNFSSSRTKTSIEFGKLGTYKRILTGTPIGTNLVNIWSQFMFLDYRIIGINYITAFKSRYMDINPWSGKPEEKNVEEFYSLIAPHMFRITKKECTDLPDKIYSTVSYTMGKDTHKHYENIKLAFMTELKSGKILEAANALAAMVRLQQILSGFLPDIDEGTGKISKMEIFSYERAEVALDIVKQIDGPVIIWARFIQDIISLKHVFSKDYGKEIATIDNINDFKNDKKRFLFLNQARGVGWNLQKKGGLSMIYHNNSFNLIHRVQSEDRGHRIGMEGSLTIFDIVADRTVDKSIAENLKGKKDLSQFVLDDLRQIVEG